MKKKYFVNKNDDHCADNLGGVKMISENEEERYNVK